MGDHFVTLVPTGSVMELPLCASGQSLHPTALDTDGIDAIPGRDPTRTGMAAYSLTGVAGPAQGLLGETRLGTGAMFLITVGEHPILTMLHRQKPESVQAGSRVTVDCSFRVLDGYDYGQIDDDLDSMADWRVLDQRPTGREAGFGDYFLNLTPEGSNGGSPD